MRSFSLVNLSCHRRQEEIARVRRFLLVNGYAEGTGLADADLVILFTCAFCHSKVVDMQAEIARIRAAIKTGCELVVGGCLPKTDGGSLNQSFSGKTVSPTDFSALDLLPDITVTFAETPELNFSDSICTPMRAPGLAAGVKTQVRRTAVEATSVLMHTWPSLPLEKVAARLDTDPRMGVFIASGCPRTCSYCAIRFATGPLRSKPLDLVTRTMAEGLERGYRKFDIYADSVGDYGVDIGTSLGALCEWVAGHQTRFSIGVQDLHPQSFLRFQAQVAALCASGRMHHLYVPLQSGNRRVLGLMNRPCDLDALREGLVGLRKQRGLFLQTSIIVGFPGETEEAFEDTVEFLSAVRFHDAFVHFYSDMPNTVSSTLPGRVGKDAMRRRLVRLERAGIKFDREMTWHEWELVPSAGAPA